MCDNILPELMWNFKIQMFMLIHLLLPQQSKYLLFLSLWVNEYLILCLKQKSMKEDPEMLSG